MWSHSAASLLLPASSALSWPDICMGSKALSGHLRTSLGLVVFPLLLSSVLSQIISDANPNPADWATLLALKAEWGGSFAGAATWKAGGIWEGVSVDSRGNVVSLELSGAGLTGGISTTIKKLQYLQVLELRNNHLSGHVSGGIFGGMKKLQAILLAGNQLSGGIPVDIFAPPSLSSLDLSNNQFSGVIPTTVGQGTGLLALDLSANSLRGSVPTQILSCTSLMWLHLNNNNLSGIVPGKIYSLQKLQVLDLSHNQLSGGVPAGLWTMRDLMHLDFSNNLLSGVLPSDVSKLQDLQVFSLAQNFLTGALPSLPGLLQPCSGTNYSCYFSPAHVNFSGNFFYGPPTTGVTVVKKGAAVTYKLCAQRDLPSQFSVAGNCLDASSLATSGASCTTTLQRPASACSVFCGTRTVGGQCGGGGVCVPWLIGPKNRPPFACRCKNGYTFAKGNSSACSKPS